MGGRGPGFSPRVSAPVRSGPMMAPRPGFGGGPRVAPRPGFRSAPVFASGSMRVRGAFAPTGRVASSRFVFDNRFDRFHRFHHFRNRLAFFDGCFGFPCFNSFGLGLGFGFGGLGFGSPFYGGYPLSSEDYYGQYAQPAQTQPVAVSSGNEVELATEVQRLSDEIQDLREDQRYGRNEVRQPPPPGTSLSVVQPSTSTTFVLRDGRRLTAQNYAITGQTIWILSENAAKKVPLADVDLTATEKVNADNGVELHLPQPPAQH